MKENISEKVHHYYWDLDINCARTTLLCLSAVMDIPIHTQVIKSAIGMHGAGCFRAQCGLVEGSLMFIGIFFAHKGRSDIEISNICYQYAKRFTEKFSSLLCYDLRPNGFGASDPPHACEELTVNAIEFTYNFIQEINT